MIKIPKEITNNIIDVLINECYIAIELDENHSPINSYIFKDKIVIRKDEIFLKDLNSIEYLINFCKHNPWKIYHINEWNIFLEYLYYELLNIGLNIDRMLFYHPKLERLFFITPQFPFIKEAFSSGEPEIHYILEKNGEKTQKIYGTDLYHLIAENKMFIINETTEKLNLIAGDIVSIHLYLEYC